MTAAAPTAEAAPLSASTIVRATLVGPDGKTLGRVDDVVVRLSDGPYPPVTGLRARMGGQRVFVPIRRISSIAPYRVTLEQTETPFGPFERRAGEVLLDQDVLGRRLINVATGRLIHANDLALRPTPGQWALVGVDATNMSRMHRFIPWRSRSGTLSADQLIDWSSVEAFTGHVPTARLPIRLRRLRSLHPAQIADLVEHATHAEGQEIITAVSGDPDLEAEVFEELNPEHQREFLEDRSDADAASMLAEMPHDAAADLITELPQERRAKLLSLLEPDREAKIRRLLAYHPETAGGLMGTESVIVPVDATASAALDAVRAATDLSPEAGSVVILVDEQRHLVGAVALSDVVRAEPGSPVRDAGTVVTARLHPTLDLPDVALMLTDYNLAALPVVDAEDTVIGVVTVDDLLEAMVPDEWRRRHQGDEDD